MPAAPSVVLDSHAFISFLRDEPGADHVAGVLEAAGEGDRPVHMTEVNYAEVQYVVRRKDGDAAWEKIRRELPGAPVLFHPVDRQLADSAADFKARFKMSLADAFAAALAKQQDAEIITGDAEFKPLTKEIKVRWLKT
jgi:ribonuclease VapC